MRYLEIKAGPWPDGPPPWWARILRKVLPAGNPDLERYYGRTCVWWLEIDDAGLPQREIGFDAKMNPVVLGPVGENCGMLVDCCDDWSDSDADSEEATRGFENTWKALWPKFEHLD